MVGIILSGLYHEFFDDRPWSYRHMGVRVGVPVEKLKNAYTKKLKHLWESANSYDDLINRLTRSRVAYFAVHRDIKNRNVRNQSLR